VKDAGEGFRQLQHARKTYEKEVLDPLITQLKAKEMSDNEIRTLTEKSDWVRKKVGGDPEKLKVLDNYIEARTKNGDNQHLLDLAAKERAQQVQKMMEAYCEKKGLAKVAVEVRDMPSNRSGEYWDGKLTLSRDYLLANTEMAKTVDTMYHELVHSEQD